MNDMKAKIATLETRGMNWEIAQLGLERDELVRAFGTALIGGFNIPYEPKELSGIVTTLRGFAPKRYLAIEGVSQGGVDYIALSVGIPSVTAVNPKHNATDMKKALRDKDMQPFDLISIDSRKLPLSADEIWKYIQGGKETVTEFGKGAPTDYGPKKTKAGTLVIFNFADKACKDLYFKVRTLDNKMHQSMYAGMVKL